MNNDIYYKLRDCLAKTPQGFPISEQEIEIKILKKLFTHEQAEIFINISGFSFLTKVKAKNKSLQKKLKLTEEKLSKKLEGMANEGLLLRQKFDSKPNEPFYMTLPFIVGLYEFSTKKMDKELAELCHEYIKNIADWMLRIPTKQLRIVPINNNIAQPKTIFHYDEIDEIIKNHYLISLSPCICALEQKSMGNTCKAPIERCIAFDWFAEHYIDTGLGRKITQDELYNIIQMGKEKGLIFSASNMQNSIGFCLCCDCCCSALRIANFDPNPAEQYQAAYLAQIDTEKCEECGLCLTRCNLDAIKIDKYYKVDSKRCVGCGICAVSCPTNAITLKNSGRKPYLPKNVADLVLKMNEEHIKLNSFQDNFILNNINLAKVKLIKFILNAADIMKSYMIKK